ncbi:hypothetical protein [Mesorhizobium neociceri]|uniref:Uncharacterized protein n=1 Tax=Mesorhizobium neociceri TaxID=1307853 RepID=A0A838B772_9HYPH|nr:hypothetical protein [Mesorhizobium neociceri]MBA1141769.1 hypothetical protein [Mesorhizobium neociceri]
MSMLSAIPYVGPIADFATSRFGLPLVVAGGIVLFYEGVPIGPVRDIPWVGPMVAGLVDGRVDREREAALVGFVSQARLDAAEAKNAEIERQLAAGRKAAALYAEMLAEAQAKNRAEDEETARRNAEYEAQIAAQGRSYRLNQSDRDFVRQP